MLGLIILLAIAYACARGLENGMTEVSKDHKKRVAKAAKKNGRRTGAKLAAWSATGLTATGTFWRGFMRGWKREWPKAKKRAATKFGRYEPEPELAIGEDIGPDGAPVAKTEPATVTVPKPDDGATDPRPAASPKPVVPEARAFVLIKNDDPEIDPTTASTTGDHPMAIAQLQEITGVNTLKAFVARYASEKNVSAEEVTSLAQRTVDELAAIESAIEQATALEFGDDGGSLAELSALRDLAIAAQAAALAYQKAALDAAALAAQSSRNIHDRHSDIQEAVAAQGGRMASKQAYTADA